MAENPDLHKRLMARQSDAELKRKQRKAARRAVWTQEDVDAAERTTDRWYAFMNKTGDYFLEINP